MESSVSTIKENHPGLLKVLIECTTASWEDRESGDFTVTVEGDNYTCHSCILESSSEFFRGLLRTNMKEKLEMKVHLSNISSAIFHLILKTLYTGCELLTKENVLEVWSAVHQLQIQFLIEHCEDFVSDNLSLDNVEMYTEQAEYFDSARVREFIFNFMLKNFETLREKEIFLLLDFQFLRNLLRSDKLVVSSEDFVLYSILDWVNYRNTKYVNENIVEKNNVNSVANVNTIEKEQQIDSIIKEEEANDRGMFLIPLIKATRYYLASKDVLLRLILSDNLLRETMLDALKFKFCDFWPANAIHRDCSDLEHVGVCGDQGVVSAYSFKQEKWFVLKDYPTTNDILVTVVKGNLYACTVGSPCNKVYVLKLNNWILVTEVHHFIKQIFTHGNNIYFVDDDGQRITRFDPEIYPMRIETIGHEIKNLTYGLSFQDTILVLSSVDNNGVEGTAVHSWNAETNVWTKLDNLEFSSQYMTYFRNEKDTYILNLTGQLWKITHSERIRFSFVAKLWNRECYIMQASLFRETLFIFDDFKEEMTMLDHVDGVYSSKRILRIEGTSSNVVNHAIPILELKPLYNTAA